MEKIRNKPRDEIFSIIGNLDDSNIETIIETLKQDVKMKAEAEAKKEEEAERLTAEKEVERLTAEEEEEERLKAEKEERSRIDSIAIDAVKQVNNLNGNVDEFENLLTDKWFYWDENNNREGPVDLAEIINNLQGKNMFVWHRFLGKIPLEVSDYDNDSIDKRLQLSYHLENIWTYFEKYNTIMRPMSEWFYIKEGNNKPDGPVTLIELQKLISDEKLTDNDSILYYRYEEFNSNSAYNNYITISQWPDIKTYTPERISIMMMDDLNGEQSFNTESGAAEEAAEEAEAAVRAAQAAEEAARAEAAVKAQAAEIEKLRAQLEASKERERVAIQRKEEEKAKNIKQQHLLINEKLAADKKKREAASRRMSMAEIMAESGGDMTDELRRKAENLTQGLDSFLKPKEDRMNGGSILNNNSLKRKKRLKTYRSPKIKKMRLFKNKKKNSERKREINLNSKNSLKKQILKYL